MVVAISIESKSWSWWFSLTSDWLKVYQKIPSKDFHATSSLLLNPDKTLRAFGFEAQQQYSDLCEENDHQSYFFFENITTIAETEQASFNHLF